MLLQSLSFASSSGVCTVHSLSLRPLHSRAHVVLANLAAATAYAAATHFISQMRLPVHSFAIYACGSRC